MPSTPHNEPGPATVTAESSRDNTMEQVLSRIVHVPAAPHPSALKMVPPANFAMVDAHVYRCGRPSKTNIPFLESLNLKSIVSLTFNEQVSGYTGIPKNSLHSLARREAQPSKEQSTTERLVKRHFLGGKRKPTLRQKTLSRQHTSFSIPTAAASHRAFYQASIMSSAMVVCAMFTYIVWLHTGDCWVWFTGVLGDNYVFLTPGFDLYLKTVIWEACWATVFSAESQLVVTLGEMYK
ncbi:hypothetical protein HDU77_002933 [Chytriomyces hyalinus]|nr:hypothetical protein HDU77_002933 [Chytriomyces hyalinus]